MSEILRQFSGSIPEHYDRYLVPFFFQPFAQDLVDRLHLAPTAQVLELACGTGIVTQGLAARLGRGARIVATDVSSEMLESAHKKLARDPRITWRQADATALPFESGIFDAVVCQFGWMFFPDRLRAAQEAKRVLRAGGQLLFNTWDSLDANPVAAELYAGVRASFPNDPPRFYDVAFGMSDTSEHLRLVTAAGFGDAQVKRIGREGAKLDPKDAAKGMIRGGPFVTEIEQRGGDTDSIIDTAAVRLKERFGAQPFAARMNAIVCTAHASS